MYIINYGIKIYGTTNTTELLRVQKTQNFAAKVALGGSKCDHVTPYLNELRWLRVNDMYRYEQGLFVFNILKNRLPEWVCTLPKVRDNHRINTRNQDKLYVPKTNTKTGDRSILVSGPQLWNSLPNHVTNPSSISSFRKTLKNHLLTS